MNGAERGILPNLVRFPYQKRPYSVSVLEIANHDDGNCKISETNLIVAVGVPVPVVENIAYGVRNL